MSVTTFYFDLGSPYAYLTAERIEKVIKSPIIWQPILLGALFKRFGTISWAFTPEKEGSLREIERRIALYGLPPVTWPPSWPANYLMAMRAATVAQRMGKTREFALIAYRLAFVEGKDLSLTENVLEAVREADLDVGLFAERIQSQEIKDALRAATDEAGDRGIDGVPTVVVNGKNYFGDDQLERAAKAGDHDVLKS